MVKERFSLKYHFQSFRYEIFNMHSNIIIVFSDTANNSTVYTHLTYSHFSDPKVVQYSDAVIPIREPRACERGIISGYI